MSTLNDESLALLQLREKLVHSKKRNEPRELIEIVESQIRQQAKADAKKRLNSNTTGTNANSSLRGNAIANEHIDIKTLIKLNTVALKLIQDFGDLDKHELESVLDHVGRCYTTMTSSYGSKVM